MKYIEINTSGNLGNEYWQIHRVGCSDIKKVLRNPGCDAYEIEADDLTTYVKNTVKMLNDQDGNDEETGFCMAHFKVFPCTKGA